MTWFGVSHGMTQEYTIGNLTIIPFIHGARSILRAKPVLNRSGPRIDMSRDAPATCRVTAISLVGAISYTKIQPSDINLGRSNIPHIWLRTL